MSSFCAIDFKAVNIYSKNKVYDGVKSLSKKPSPLAAYVLLRDLDQLLALFVESRLVIVYAKSSLILTNGFRSIEEKFTFS